MKSPPWILQSDLTRAWQRRRHEIPFDDVRASRLVASGGVRWRRHYHEYHTSRGTEPAAEHAEHAERPGLDRQRLANCVN
jgi:hypothetical protein